MEIAVNKIRKKEKEFFEYLIVEINQGS